MGNHNVLPAMAVQRWVYIKYFCALSVVVSHLCKLIYLGPAFSQFFDFGTYAVAIFFFLSGYGLSYSCIYKKNYLKNFLKRRLLKIFLIYFIATLLWVVICLPFVEINIYDLWRICSVYPILPYGWYFVVLMVLYLIFYLSMKWTYSSVLIYIVLIVGYIVCFLSGIGEWIYMTSPCFALGIWYAENEDRFSVFIHRYKYRIFVALLIAFGCSWRSYFLKMLHVQYTLQTFNGIIACTISALALVGVIIVILETCKLPFLTSNHLPDYSFEIYLSQCISILFVMYYMNHSTSSTMFTIANFQCVVYLVFMTGILVFLFHLIIHKIQKYVSK